MASNDLATKGYVDGLRRTKFIASSAAPSNVPIGTIWYELPPNPYTFAQVDAMSITYSQVDNLGLRFNNVDKGGWNT